MGIVNLRGIGSLMSDQVDKMLGQSMLGQYGPNSQVTGSNQMAFNTFHQQMVEQMERARVEAIRERAQAIARQQTFGSGGGGGGIMGSTGIYGGSSAALNEAVLVLDKPEPLKLDLTEPPQKPIPQKIKVMKEAELQEYAELAEELGYRCHELLIEGFKVWLDANDIPVFNFEEVKKYMDAKCAKEGENGGWYWRPLRECDRVKTSFGRAGHYIGNSSNIAPASDHYYYGGVNPDDIPIYNKTIPLHALKKAALINKSPFKGKVALMVTDYAPKPEYRPDPFLMVVIANPEISSGVGRYIVDFWDEPGFGLAQQLA